MEETMPAIPGYEVLGELGRGGMGIVYKARNLQYNRLVALKMILSGRRAVILELARFRIEAEAIASLVADGTNITGGYYGYVTNGMYGEHAHFVVKQAGVLDFSQGRD